MEIRNKTAPCPRCGHNGVAVPYITVASLTTDEAKKSLIEGDYSLCTSPDCTVAYFSETTGTASLSTEQIKVPLHFKTEAHKRYACYCNKVTEEEVRSIVEHKGITQMQPIIRLLRDEAQSDCRHRNPFGRCCAEQFHHVIATARAQTHRHLKGEDA